MALPKTLRELNQEVGYRVSEPIDGYFEPMRITRAQKDKRVALAYDLEEVVKGLLIDAFYARKYGVVLSFDELNQLNRQRTRAVNLDNPLVRAREEYIDAVGEYIEVTDDVIDHIDDLIIQLMLVIARHPDDPFYYSNDRARAVAENDSNTIWNGSEYEDAIRIGKTKKTWHTIMDGRERDSHAEMNGVTVGINELFELRGGLMAYPRDLTYDPSMEEVSNCRCSCSYT